jgi:hypothetical protein
MPTETTGEREQLEEYAQAKAAPACLARRGAARSDQQSRGRRYDGRRRVGYRWPAATHVLLELLWPR